MRLYNSLTRKVEEFVPNNPSRVGMYTCGPTVYSFVTIGNWRTYIFADLVYRSLRANGYQVTHVMNITDVGHLTGDADIGDDKVEKSAREQGRSAWEIAEFYTKDFLRGMSALNIVRPQTLPRATQHIKEQISLIKKLEENQLTYKTSDGIYFSVQAYEERGVKYGVLSTLDEIKEGARVAKNPEKRDGRDFALWKFSPKDVQRQMEWDSPWGVGFPGWHIECSAMSMKYLGEQFDLHLGGEDLRSTHHPNEIAQSEGATGKSPFVKYWLHGAFLRVDGRKMSKSLGNLYTLSDLKERGFSPLDFRYLTLQAHYRKPLNFTFSALRSAQQSYRRLKRFMEGFSAEGAPSVKGAEKDDFLKALNDDLNAPRALAVVWQIVSRARRGDLPMGKARALLAEFDQVLGLNLTQFGGGGGDGGGNLPPKVADLLKRRKDARLRKDFVLADDLRSQLEALGYRVVDTAQGQNVSRLTG